MIFIAFVSTVAVGFVAEGVLGSWLNWPGAGAVFAAATAAAFILGAVRGQKETAGRQSGAKTAEDGFSGRQM